MDMTPELAQPASARRFDACAAFSRAAAAYPKSARREFTSLARSLAPRRKRATRNHAFARALDASARSIDDSYARDARRRVRRARARGVAPPARTPHPISQYTNLPHAIRDIHKITRTV